MVKGKIRTEFDMMSHNLVPHHIIISEKEKEELLKKYSIEPNQLPKILDTDPISKFIGAKPGQIIKIIRNSHTAKIAIAYRLVVESSE